MIMVKMQIPGITIEVPEGEVSLYKRAGYSVVVDEPAPAPEPVIVPEPEPIESEQPAKKVKK